MGLAKCKECGQPMLPKGMKRKDPSDYRHARGCPLAPKAEAKATERMWAIIERKACPPGKIALYLTKTQLLRLLDVCEYKIWNAEQRGCVSNESILMKVKEEIEEALK